MNLKVSSALKVGLSAQRSYNSLDLIAKVGSTAKAPNALLFNLAAEYNRFKLRAIPPTF